MCILISNKLCVFTSNDFAFFDRAPFTTTRFVIDAQIRGLIVDLTAAFRQVYWNFTSPGHAEHKCLGNGHGSKTPLSRRLAGTIISAALTTKGLSFKHRVYRDRFVKTFFPDCSNLYSPSRASLVVNVSSFPI